MNDTAEETYHSRMTRKLTAAFAPIALEIRDDSASHRGHTGHNPRGESHFKVMLVSAAFEGLSQIARHREVYRVLAEELQKRIHAINLQCLTPEEYTLW